MKRFATLALLLAAALPVAAGLTDLDNPGPSVTAVTARQRYPWNGLVDVDVSFEGKSGETYRIELSATDKTGGTNLPVRTAWLEGTPAAVGNPVDVPAPGTHRLVWNAGADLPAGFVADRVTVTAKLLNPIWSFASIPEIDPNDVWAPATVYHDVQTVAAYGEIEDHEPTVRCLTDEWNLESTLGANVVFSGSSMGLRYDPRYLSHHWISLWARSDSTNRYRMVTLDYFRGTIIHDNPSNYETPGADIRFFQMRDGDGRQFADSCRQGYDSFWKSANSDISSSGLLCRYADAEHGSAVCGYFPNGIPLSDSSSTSVSSYEKGVNAAVFFSGEAGTDMKEAVVLCGGSAGVRATSKYSCMGNAVGRYVVPLLDGNAFFTVGYPVNRECAVQHFGVAVGSFTNHCAWSFIARTENPGWDPSITASKGVAMPDGHRIFLGGAGKAKAVWSGKVRMWQGSNRFNSFADYPIGHPFEAWNRRDVTCLLPNGKFCGVDEELGLVVVNPLTGETYVASDDPAFKKGKMGCQLLPNGKVWIIPYDCEGREFAAGTNLCGKLYEVDFGFTRSFSLSSLCSPYLRVAEGDPEPSGIKVGLDPNGGELPGIYAMYYKGANPVYGELPVPTWTGHAFLGWSTDGTAANLVAATDPVPPLGILLKAAWQANGYTVKFNANGGSGTMSNQSFTYGVAQALTANAFTRTGYAFSGWATSATGTKVYNDKQSVSNLTTTSGGMVNLYAVWTPITYTVRFNANNGTGSMADQTFTYDVAQNLREIGFTRSGYLFDGWATSAGADATYRGGASVKNLASTQGAVVTLYAVWAQDPNWNRYMVIDLSGGTSASSYPVSYLSDVPSGGWSDEYKTSKLVLRRIEPGTFTMGSPSGEIGRYNTFEDRHSVTLSQAFYIGVFEVSQKQWKNVTGGSPSPYSGDARAVDNVSYADIRGSSNGTKWPASSAVDSTSFLGKLRSKSGLSGLDLPTDAQWEYACRAGTTTALNSGKNLSSTEQDSNLAALARYRLNSGVSEPATLGSDGVPLITTTSDGKGGYTAQTKVGSYTPNAWGLYDMHGNVWEWCLDWWQEGLGTSAATNPKGPTSGIERVQRGGGWWFYAKDCRSAVRHGYSPSFKNKGFGFRLCMPAQ